MDSLPEAIAQITSNDVVSFSKSIIELGKFLDKYAKSKRPMSDEEKQNIACAKKHISRLHAISETIISINFIEGTSL